MNDDRSQPPPPQRLPPPPAKADDRRNLSALPWLLLAFGAPLLIWFLVRPTSIAEASTRPVTSGPTECEPATARQLSEIENHLKGGHELDLAFQGTDEDGRLHVAASIYRTADDVRVSSADNWLWEGPDLYALSGSANDYSTLPDGRRLTDASWIGVASDIRDCATKAIRNR